MKKITILLLVIAAVTMAAVWPRNDQKLLSEESLSEDVQTIADEVVAQGNNIQLAFVASQNAVNAKDHQQIYTLLNEKGPASQQGFAHFHFDASEGTGYHSMDADGFRYLHKYVDNVVVLPSGEYKSYLVVQKTEIASGKAVWQMYFVNTFATSE